MVKTVDALVRRKKRRWVQTAVRSVSAAGTSLSPWPSLQCSMEPQEGGTAGNERLVRVAACDRTEGHWSSVQIAVCLFTNDAMECRWSPPEGSGFARLARPFPIGTPTMTTAWMDSRCKRTRVALRDARCVRWMVAHSSPPPWVCGCICCAGGSQACSFRLRAWSLRRVWQSWRRRA
jgi:hypothetical protein